MHGPIRVVLAAFVGLAILYSVVIPLGEGPDEPGHAAYVFFLAREWRLPIQQSDAHASDVPGEGHQPPLAYLMVVPLVLWLPPTMRQIDLPGNARFIWNGGDQRNAVAHGSREYLPWRGAVLAWHLGRLGSVLLGAFTVAFTYLAALQLPLQNAGSPVKPALLAATLVALNPQFLFTSALITNDTLLVALSSLLLWVIVRPARELYRQSIITGTVLGLALLTKQSAVMLVPLVVLSLLVRARADSARYRNGAAAPFGSRMLFRAGISLIISLGVAMLIAGWWYVRNWQLYGDPFGLAFFRAEFVTQRFEIDNPIAWKDALSQLHDSFWARFGWMNVLPPSWVIAVFVAIELLGLLGLLAIARRPSHEACSHKLLARLGGTIGQLAGHWALLFMLVLAFGWIVSFALTAGLVAWQGRLLFPALPSIAIILARGLMGWSHSALPRPIHDIWPSHAFLRDGGIWLLGIGALLPIAVWLPIGVIQPAYPFQTLPEPVALQRRGMPVYGRFSHAGEPGAELLGWQVRGHARPGSTIDISLIWHALSRQNRDWIVFVHLVDANERILAEDNRQPRNGMFPMTQWVAGDWVEDHHPLTLPADLSPGSYKIRVGLYDEQINLFAKRYNREGQQWTLTLELGPIVVERPVEES